MPWDPASARVNDERSLEGFRRQLGEDHPYTIVCGIDVASDLGKDGCIHFRQPYRFTTPIEDQTTCHRIERYSGVAFATSLGVDWLDCQLGSQAITEV